VRPECLRALAAEYLPARRGEQVAGIRQQHLGRIGASRLAHSLSVLGTAILLIVALISKLRVHPFLSLMAASLLVGVGTGMSPTAMVAAFDKGMG
jgi:hypothetical protein